MLKKLLRLAVDRSSVNTSELAHELHVSPGLVRQMLEQLTHLGYLQAVPGSLTPCERCPLRAASAYRNRPCIWSLTPKGADYLARR